MKMKKRSVGLGEAFRGVLLLCIAAALLGTPIRAQEIHIRVLNARTGKPISNECVNVSLGAWHGADLIAPTNKEAVVVLRMARNEVTADTVSPSPCERTAIVGPKPLPKDVNTIAITSDEYVDCQEWAKVIPGQAPKDNLNRAPSYRIEKILESGVAASNRCGKFRAEAKPGELIFFVRPRSFWERLKE
jgi:hypothetical protein